MLGMKKILISLLAFILLLPAAACSNDKTRADNRTGGYTFTDSEGVTVQLAEKPKTVAVLFSSYADIWECAGGKVDITVYESVERGFAGEDAVIVDSGSGHSTIDLETLIAAKPDFVIGTADYDSQCQAVEFCRSAGIPSALFRVESFEDYLNMLDIFCSLTGKEENYQEYGVEVRQRIDWLLESLPENSEAAKILFVRAGSSANSTKAKTSGDNFACAMLSQLGSVNIADTDTTFTGTLSLEVIMQENPEYLFISTMGDENAAKDYMNSQLSSEGWRELECVKNGNYYYLPKELFHYKPNSRWADAYEYLASILYPEM